MTSSEQLFEKASRFRPVEKIWAAAAGVDKEDVRQQILLALIADEDPTRAVPAALGIRKLAGGWRSTNPAVCASIADAAVVDVAAHDEEEIDSLDAADDGGLLACASGGTTAIASRCGIGRRAAQLRVAKQIARFETCGDLFFAAKQ